jgi:hypothetical protein
MRDAMALREVARLTRDFSSRGVTIRTLDEVPFDVGEREPAPGGQWRRNERRR